MNECPHCKEEMVFAAELVGGILYWCPECGSTCESDWDELDVKTLSVPVRQQEASDEYL